MLGFTALGQVAEGDVPLAKVPQVSQNIQSGFDDFGQDFGSDFGSTGTPTVTGILAETGVPAGYIAPGAQSDLVARLASLVPNSWFPEGAPVYNTFLNGAASNLSWAYNFYIYVLQQSRLSTMTGVWLDRFAYDFFGTSFPRRSWAGSTGTTAYEQDQSYRSRIQVEILLPRTTRQGIAGALQNATGRAPVLIEPFNPGDCAAYGENSWYGQVGIYGSLLCNNQIFVTAFRPFGEGIPNIAGYNYGYYGAGNTAYVDLSQITGQVTDTTIYATGAQTVAAGVVCWMDIEDAQKPIPTLLGLDFSQAINSQNLIPWFTG